MKTVKLSWEEINDITILLYRKIEQLKSEGLSQMHEIEKLEAYNGELNVKDTLEIAKELYQDCVEELEHYSKLFEKFRKIWAED